MKDMPPTPPPKEASRPSIHLNIEDWLPYLSDSNATEAQKILLIETLWDILLVFLDHGWKLGNGKNISGQSFDLTAALHDTVLNCPSPHEQSKEQK